MLEESHIEEHRKDHVTLGGGVGWGGESVSGCLSPMPSGYSSHEALLRSVLTCVLLSSVFSLH